MYKLIKQPEDQLRILFRNTAQKTGIHEAIVEKDFWVCLTLDYLFHSCPWKKAFTFKGGTSLSKCYGLIKRFSEDIDLILDWRVLGYGLNEPWEQRSNTKQDVFNKEANSRAEAFLSEQLLPVLREDMSRILGKEANFYILPEDPQTICFQYPKVFEDSNTMQIIRLEIGALAAWTPSVAKSIAPYVADAYPKIFSKPDTTILTASAERTFWEKATILHHEANRPENLSMPGRYSRHYYDLYCIAQSDIKESAYSNVELLKRVTDFKTKFYPRKWAHYELAVPGTLKLLPPEYRMEDLQKDYVSMKNMMFGEYPDFHTLMKFIGNLELEINSLRK